jgi:tetratricopeptide (TPR) repeat protein
MRKEQRASKGLCMRKRVALLLLALPLSSAAQFGEQSHRPGPGEPSPRELNRTTITIRVVLEDGSPLAVNPQIVPYSEEDCHVSDLFRDGTVRLEVRTKSVLASDYGPQEPGCRLWRVILPGYQAASGYVRNGTTVKMYRLGDHEGSSVSITTLNAPKNARKAYERGEASLAKGRLSQAEQYFSTAVTLYPGYATAWSEFGVALERQGRFSEARAAFLKSYEADPKYIKPLVQRARIAAKQNDWSEEQEAAKQAIDLHAIDFPAAYYSYAEASYHLGRLEEADQNCRRAIELDPRGEVPSARFLLGIVLAQSGKTYEAAENLRAFLKLVSSGAEAEAAREQIKALGQPAKSQP